MSGGGGKEIISNGKDGFLFRVGDYKRLAELIKKNIGKNAKMRKNAEKKAKNYLWSNLITSYIKLFREVGK